MSGYVEHGQLAGVVTLIARKGEIVHFEAIGKAQLDPERSMKKDTLFRIYSMSKPITSAAVMILYEEGKLLLKDPVSKYIPELTNLRVYVSGAGDAMLTEPARREITVLDLLTHTSGFIYDFTSTEAAVVEVYRDLGIYPTDYYLGAPGERPTDFHDDETFLARLAEAPLAHQPGERFTYGVNTDVLGIVVERVSGMPFEDFLQKRLFNPLKMSDTSFYVRKEDRGRFAASYMPGPNGGLMVQDNPGGQSPFLAPPRFASGGAGLISTAEDYFRFCQMILNGGELDGVRILGPHTVRYMRTNLLGDRPLLDETLADATTGYGTNSLGFGIGFSIVNDPAGMSGPVGKGELAWGGAASTVFWIDPENQIVAILLTQMVPYNAYPLPTRFRALVYQALLD